MFQILAEYLIFGADAYYTKYLYSENLSKNCTEIYQDVQRPKFKFSEYLSLQCHQKRRYKRQGQVQMFCEMDWWYDCCRDHIPKRQPFKKPKPSTTIPIPWAPRVLSTPWKVKATNPAKWLARPTTLKEKYKAKLSFNSSLTPAQPSSSDNREV